MQFFAIFVYKKYYKIGGVLCISIAVYCAVIELVSVAVVAVFKIYAKEFPEPVLYAVT